MSGAILNKRELLSQRETARQQGRRVVHCHGCFDIVHPGHLRHLRQAKACGDILLVTLTGDAAMKKGTGRPLIPEELRAENLAALDCVDWVHVEQRPTAAELLDEVQPDVYVKGREYELNQDPRFAAERAAVERHGGRVVFSSGDVVFSSTALIAALEQSADPYHARLRSLLADPALGPSRLAAMVASCRGTRMVIVGECVRETYISCARPTVSGEQPVMSLRPVEHRSFDGGAAGMALQLAALGAMTTLVTVLDDSDEAQMLRRRLLAAGVEVRSPASRGTLSGGASAVPEVQRFMVNSQVVFRLELTNQVRLDAAEQEELVRLADDAGKRSDGAIIADFGAGLNSAGVVKQLVQRLRRQCGVLAAGAPNSHGRGGGALRHMRRLDLACLSEADLRQATGMFDEALPAAAWKWMSEFSAASLAVGLGGEDGLLAFSRLPDADQRKDEWRPRVRAEHIPALAAPVVDATGCAETLLAVASLMLTAHRDAPISDVLLSAMFIGAMASGIESQRVGVAPVDTPDVRRAVSRLHGSHLTFAPERIATRPVLQVSEPAAAS